MGNQIKEFQLSLHPEQILKRSAGSPPEGPCVLDELWVWTAQGNRRLPTKSARVMKSEHLDADILVYIALPSPPCQFLVSAKTVKRRKGRCVSESCFTKHDTIHFQSFFLHNYKGG